MRSAALLALALVAAVPAGALAVVDPPPIVTAYHIEPVQFGDNLTLSPLNPAIVASPGGAAVGFRATRLSDPDPEVQAWVHDLGTGQTESAELAGSAYTQVLGISADGDVLLLADSLGRPHLRSRSRAETVRIDPPPGPETLTLAAIALSADAGTVWMQWAAPITDPDERGSGWAVFEQDGGLGEGTITLLDEPLPLAGSPSLEWQVRVAGDVVELTGPSGSTRLPELGEPAHLQEVTVTDPTADGAVVAAFISTDPGLPGGSNRCGGGACAEVYRTAIRDGSAGPVEWLSVGDGDARLEDHASGLTVTPRGDLVGFVAETPLVGGPPSDGVSNVFVAGTTHLRVISLFNNGTADVEGGRWPTFLTGNDLLFYADLFSVSELLADPAAPGLHTAEIQPFDDMAVTAHEGAIWWAVEQGITHGCTSDRFCPSRPVTRAQAASLLARALGLAPLAEGPFVDVAGTHAGSIDALAADGIVLGCTADRFCPETPVTRAQTASLLARALGLAPTTDGPFGDVSGVHAPAINALAAAGITTGCAPDRFCPDTPSTRAQMATLLYRAFGGDAS